jgi:anti-anti-sigma factor
MAITTSQHGEHLVVTLREEISHLSGSVLRDQIVKALQPQAKAVFLDLRQVSFINSVAIGDLVGTKTTLDDQGVATFLVAPSPAVSRVLAYARLDSIFEILQEFPQGLADQIGAAASVAGERV